jgi:hypothetical protein
MDISSPPPADAHLFHKDIKRKRKTSTPESLAKRASQLRIMSPTAATILFGLVDELAKQLEAILNKEDQVDCRSRLPITSFYLSENH